MREAPYISSVHLLFLPVGVLIFDFISSRFGSSQLKISYIMQAVKMIGHLGLCLVSIFLYKSAFNFAIFFVMTGTSSGGPMGYHTTTEMKVRAQGARELYLALSFSRFLSQFFVFVELVAVGYLMEKGNISLT